MMLKRVHDGKSRASSVGSGVSRREELTLWAFSCNNGESVIQVVPSGGATHCHPELVSGSGFDLISAQRVFLLKRSAALKT